MSVEPKKRTFGPGICVWCGRCGEKSPLCSEACESDWATISADPETVEDRALLEAMAPSHDYWRDRKPKHSTPLQKAARELLWQEELGLETPDGRYRKAWIKVHDRAKALYGLVSPNEDMGSPLFPKAEMKPVDLKSDRDAKPDYADWSWHIQSQWTDDPELRVIHGLLHLRMQFGRLYNELLETGRLKKWSWDSAPLEGAIDDLKWIAEDAKGLVVEEREAA